MNKVINMSCSETIENRGIDLAMKNQFQFMSLGSGEENKYFVEAWYKNYVIDLYFEYIPSSDTAVLHQARCDCPHDALVCKHIIGAFLNYIETEFKFSDEAGFIDMNEGKRKTVTDVLIANAIMDQIDNSSENKYEIIPEFIEEGTRIGVKFKIGVIGGKSFVVKDVYKLDFLFSSLSREIYGSNTEIIHDIHLFENKEFVKQLLTIISIASMTLSGVEARGSKDWYGYYHQAELKYDKKVLMLTDEQVVSLLSLLEGTKVKYVAYNQKANQYKIEKCEEKINFNISNIDDDTIEFKSSLEYSRLLECDNKIVVVNHIKKTIDMYEYPNAQIQTIVAVLIQENIEIVKENAYNFEQSVLSRIDKYIAYEGDISMLYEDAPIYDFETLLILEGDSLNIVGHFVDENEEDIEHVEPANIKLETMLTAVKLGEKYADEESPLDYSIVGINNIIDFINDEMETIESYSDIIKSNEAFKNFKLIKKVSVSTSINQSGNSTILKFESSEFSESELLSILKSFEQSEDYLALENGRVVDLKSEDISKLVNTCNQLEVDIVNAKNLEFEIDKASIFYLNSVFENIEAMRNNDKLVDDMVNDYNKFDKLTRKRYPNINAELRDYQRVGVNWLSFLYKYNFGGILADDMGLGKTLQVISHLSNIKSTKPTIIITPASLIYNWQHEYKKFCPQTEVIVMDGTKTERSKLMNAVIGEVVCIVSYDTFKRDIEQFTEIEFNYAILDEAQHIKNNNTKIAKCVKSLNSEYRLALTGTPIENNLNDLWSLFEFVIPGYLGTNKDFKKQYITPIENGDRDKQQMLRRKIEPFILRRLKSEVLTELPEKTEKVIKIKMDSDQQKVYDATALQLKQFIDGTSAEEINKKQIEILAMITKMRQIACNPALSNTSYQGSIAKTDHLLEMLETLIANGRKVVIFSQFVSNFDHLETEFKKLGYENYKITGSTPKGKRHGLVEKFNNNDVPIFLISLKAGGTGLNITGADTVIHFDPWWNTAAENQATDRVHRMGQKKNVLVYKLICERTIEEQIEKLQESKRMLAENLLEADEVKSTKITKDDLISLFD